MKGPRKSKQAKFEDQNVLLRLPSVSELQRVSEEVFVSVVVNGRVLQLPEDALSDGAGRLQLATEGYVGLADYAESVALVLAALEKRGLVILS